MATQELSCSCGNLRPAMIKTLGISSLALIVVCAKFVLTSIQSPISESVELNQVRVPVKHFTFLNKIYVMMFSFSLQLNFMDDYSVKTDNVEEQVCWTEQA